LVAAVLTLSSKVNGGERGRDAVRGRQHLQCLSLASLLSWISFLRFLCLRYHGFSDGSVVLSSLPGYWRFGTRCAETLVGGSRRLSESDLQHLLSTFLWRSNTPHHSTTHHLNESQAFLISVILLGWYTGDGRNLLFLSLDGLRPAEGKKLDWLHFHIVTRRGSGSDRKQDSTQPQAGATCSHQKD